MEVPKMNTPSAPGAEVITAPAEAIDAATFPVWGLAGLAALAMAVMWLVGFDNGQLTGILDGTGSFAHELFHDGRHLFGAPCH
jgi:hypothetical protein